MGCPCNRKAGNKKFEEGKMNYKEYFDRVVIISLKRRQDRRRRLEKLIKSCRWPFKQPEWFDAIEGSKIPATHGFYSGGGALGCKLSWCRVLEDAMNDDLNSILVLEDDCIWRNDFVKQVDEFLRKIPADWEAMFLGGQNMKTPKRVTDGVSRSTNTQRTHAIGLQREGIRKAYVCMMESKRHIDHLLGPETGKWKRAYQPEPFLIGQDACKSDISGRADHSRFWTSPIKEYPVCWIRCPREVADKLSEYGLHRGFDREVSGRDRGLMDCFPTVGSYKGGIKKFLSSVSWEAASFLDNAGIVTVWDSFATKECEEKLMEELPKRVFVAEFETLEEGLDLLKQKFGENFVRIREDQKLMPVILCQSPANVVSALKERNLVHFGRWINKKTGIDQGLIHFFDTYSGSDLTGWFTALDSEARENNIPVGVWHPKATVEMCKTTGRDVVVIDTMSPEEAISQVREIVG